MSDRLDLNETYMRMAEIWAMRSKAQRRKVGALLVRDKQIISDGYNGMPAGDNSPCEYETENGLVTKKEVLHAEANAISKLAKNGGMGANGSTLYVTTSPCIDCAKMIINAGIRRVFYREEYTNLEGVYFLRKYAILTEQLKDQNDNL